MPILEKYNVTNASGNTYSTYNRNEAYDRYEKQRKEAWNYSKQTGDWKAAGNVSLTSSDGKYVSNQEYNDYYKFIQ